MQKPSSIFKPYDPRLGYLAMRQWIVVSPDGTVVAVASDEHEARTLAQWFNLEVEDGNGDMGRGTHLFRGR